MALNHYLKKFLDHYNFLISEGDDSELITEYKSLRDAGSALIAKKEDYPRFVGSIAANRSKNRYKDIVPFDSTRVKLKELADMPHSDYINANYIKGIHGNSAYIASQAPLPHTVNDFWRMIWETDVRVVLMACNEYEGKKLKCTRYWPVEEPSMKFGNVQITLKSVDERNNGDFVVRRLQVESEGESRTVMQYHYTAWPDHGIPTSMTPILDLLSSARTYQPHDDPPIIVHCSAGCGRTGTLIAIDYLWNLLKHNMITEDISVLTILLDMRMQRQSLVQTSEQYEVVYRAIIDLFETQIRHDENNYENVSIDDHQARKTRFSQLSAESVKTNSKSVQEADRTSSSSYHLENGNTQPPQQPPQEPSPPPRARNSAKSVADNSHEEKKGKRVKAEYVNTTVKVNYVNIKEPTKSPHEQNVKVVKSSEATVGQTDRQGVAYRQTDIQKAEVAKPTPPSVDSVNFKKLNVKQSKPQPLVDSERKSSATISLGNSIKKPLRPPIVPKPLVSRKPVSGSSPTTPTSTPVETETLYALADEPTVSSPALPTPPPKFRAGQLTAAKTRSMELPSSPATLQSTSWKSEDFDTIPASTNESSGNIGAMYHLAGEVAEAAAGKSASKQSAKPTSADDDYTEYAYVDSRNIQAQAAQMRKFSETPATQYTLQADIDEEVFGGETEYSLAEDEDGEAAPPPPVPVKRFTGDDDEDYAPVEHGASGSPVNGKPTLSGGNSMPAPKSFGGAVATLFGHLKMKRLSFDARPKGKSSSWPSPSNGIRRTSNTSNESNNPDEIIYKGMNMAFPHQTKRLKKPSQMEVPPPCRR